MTTPRNRLTRRGNVVPTGYPMGGLVGYWDMMVDNWLLWPGDLANAAWVKTDISAPTYADGWWTLPDAAAQAYSVLRQTVVVPTGTQAYTFGVEFRNVETGTLALRLVDGAAETIVPVTLDGTGVAKTASMTITHTGTAANFQCDIIWGTYYAGLSAFTSVQVRRPQLNPGTSAREYVATTDLQSLGSLYGKAATLQRGATSGAEASDGSYGLNGWGGVTDDYQLGSALADGTMAGSFDIPLVGLFAGTAGTIVSLAASGATDQYQRVAYNGSGQIRIGTKAGAGAETFSADLAVSTTAIVALRLRSDGTTLTLTNHATGTSVTLASQSPTGACRLGIGCTAGSTVADIASAITATLGTVHGSMLSTAGWTRAYRDLKARAARKGVTVTP